MGELLAKRLSLKQLGHEIGLAVLEPEVVERDHVGVVQRAGGASLSLETLEGGGIGPQRLGDDLDRHLSAEPRVARPVDLGHPAGAEEGNDLEMPDSSLRGSDAPLHTTPRGLAVDARENNPRRAMVGAWSAAAALGVALSTQRQPMARASSPTRR